MRIFDYRLQIKLVGAIGNQQQVSVLSYTISSPIASTIKHGHHLSHQRHLITTAVQKWNGSHDPISVSRYDTCRNLIGSNLWVTQGVRIFVRHIEKNRSCAWVWPDTLFWLLWGIDVVMLCVCRWAMYVKHNFLTVWFFFLFVLTFSCFFGRN